MRVRMLRSLAGVQNGRPYSRRKGSEIEVEEAEGRSMVAAGLAALVEGGVRDFGETLAVLHGVEEIAPAAPAEAAAPAVVCGPAEIEELPEIEEEAPRATPPPRLAPPKRLGQAARVPVEKPPTKARRPAAKRGGRR